MFINDYDTLLWPMRRPFVVQITFSRYIQAVGAILCTQIYHIKRGIPRRRSCQHCIECKTEYYNNTHCIRVKQRIIYLIYSDCHLNIASFTVYVNSVNYMLHRTLYLYPYTYIRIIRVYTTVDYISRITFSIKSEVSLPR